MEKDFCISQGQALTLLNSRKDKHNKVDFFELAKQLLMSCGHFKSLNTIAKSTEEHELLDSVIHMCRKRYIRLHDKAKKVVKKTGSGMEVFAREVFVDLTDFPSLLSSGSQCSQASSRSSVLSDLELSVPFESLKKRKNFDDLSSTSKRARTSGLYDQLLKTAESENVSPARLAAYLGFRASYMSNKSLAHSFQSLFDGANSLNKVDTTLAIYLKEHCQIGRSVYTDVRLLLRKQVEFPPYHELSSLVKNILPTLIPFEHGVRANLKEILRGTVERILSSYTQIFTDDTISTGIVCQVKIGIDGSGSHAVYNSATSLRDGVDTSHMLVVGFTIPSIVVNDVHQTVIFQDRQSSSVFSEHPLVLIPGGETRERFGRVLKLIETEIDEISTGILVAVPNGDNQKIKCIVMSDVSQLNGKAISAATGLQGAYCTGCTAKKMQRRLNELLKVSYWIGTSMT